MYIVAVWTYDVGRVDKGIYKFIKIEHARECIDEFDSEHDVYKYKLTKYNVGYMDEEKLEILFKLQENLNKLNINTLSNKNLTTQEGFGLNDVLSKAKFTVDLHVRNCLVVIDEKTVVKGFEE